MRCRACGSFVHSSGPPFGRVDIFYPVSKWVVSTDTSFSRLWDFSLSSPSPKSSLVPAYRTYWDAHCSLLVWFLPICPNMQVRGRYSHACWWGHLWRWEVRHCWWWRTVSTSTNLSRGALSFEMLDMSCSCMSHSHLIMTLPEVESTESLKNAYNSYILMLCECIRIVASLVPDKKCTIYFNLMRFGHRTKWLYERHQEPFYEI